MNEVTRVDKILNWIKNNKVLSIIVVILIVLVFLIGFANGIFDFYNNFFNYKNSEVANSTKSKSDSIIPEQNYLVFHTEEDFDKWHKEVNFKRGLPRHGRNLKTDEVNLKITTKKYTYAEAHPDPQNKKVFCGFDEGVPNELINETAEKKYDFIKVTHRDLEEMGFISDKIEVISENVSTFKIEKIPYLTNHVKGFTELYNSSNFKKLLAITPEKIPGLSFHLFIRLKKNLKNRNKYIFDYGTSMSKDRISLYLDKNNNLCFRVISVDSHAFTVKIIQKINTYNVNELFYLNCRLGYSNNLSIIRILINGNEVAKKEYSCNIKLSGTLKGGVGCNINGQYCCGLMMPYYSIDVVRPIITLNHIIINSMDKSSFTVGKDSKIMKIAPPPPSVQLNLPMKLE